MSDALLTPRMTLSIAHTMALAIAREIEHTRDLDNAQAEAAELRRTLVAMFDETKIVLDYVDTQEKNLREMVEEANQREREITRLQRALLEAERTAEQATCEMARALDSVSAAFNDIRGLPQRLAAAVTGEFPRPMGVLHITNEPRDAAKRSMMAAATKPEHDATPGTAVATTASDRIANTRAALRERNELVAAIRGTQWGRDTSPTMARAVAHYCLENGLDPVRHVEILGGKIYLTAEFYDERGIAMLRSGEVIPDEPDIISADARLDALAANGDEWAIGESTRRIRERIKHGVPEKSLAAVVQRFRLAKTGQTIIGVNWCGGNGRRDPVGDAEPTKTATTRARRRAWKQIADVVPEYGRVVKPIEATARIASEHMPIEVVDEPRRTAALITAGADEYNANPDRAFGVNNAPIPPAQHSDDPARTAEDGELPFE